MEKMSLLGNDESSLVDCSSVITDAFASSDSVAKAKADTSSNTAVASSPSTSSNSSFQLGRKMTGAYLALVLSIALALVWI